MKTLAYIVICATLLGCGSIPNQTVKYKIVKGKKVEYLFTEDGWMEK